MKALEASAHVTAVGRDSQGTIKWLHCAAHKMRVLMLLFVKRPDFTLISTTFQVVPNIFVSKMSILKFLLFILFYSMKY